MTVIPYTPWPAWEDALGHLFKPGDFCAHAYTTGQTGSLQFGQVISINRYRKNGEEIVINVRWDNNTRQWITKPSCTITVIPILKVRIHSPAGPIETWTDRQFERSPHFPDCHEITDRLNHKKTWQKPHNVLKVDPIPLAVP